MPIELLLARHGNTFAKGDKVVWVGARTDLALTAEGEAQALRLHAALAAEPPAYALTGPLQRTRRHAELALGGGAVIEIRDALREIDYGAWEALSTDEIHARGGGEALTRWDQHSVWPAAPGWTPSEAQMLSNAREILAEVAARAAPRALIVSSNG
ncbi:MAG: histidine phosphatase family protein, partial [Hyphomonadaceae bacterium]